MAAQPARFGAPNPTEPVVYELPAVRHQGEDVSVELSVRRALDGVWRARLVFLAPHRAEPLETAEIFCAPTEQDVFQAVRDLGEHQLRNLYRSLAE
jgi:hypothetical protein